MAERRERDAILREADAEIDELFAPLARAVAASVRRHGGAGPVTPLVRALVLRDLDERILPPAFGKFNGDENAPLFRLVVRRAQHARLAAVERQIADVRRRLRREPELIERLGLGDGR